MSFHLSIACGLIKKRRNTVVIPIKRDLLNIAKIIPSKKKVFYNRKNYFSQRTISLIRKIELNSRKLRFRATT